MTEVLSGSLVAVIGVIGIWITARAKIKGDRDTRDISWFDKLTARVDAQDKRIAELQAELSDVRLENFTLRALVQAFVEYVRKWRRLLPRDQWPEAPTEVEDRMG